MSKDETEPRARAVADQAVAELAALNSRIGRFDRLETLFKDIDGRDIRGSATEKVAAAREGLWGMTHTPETAFRCGPMALGRILAFERPKDAPDVKITGSKSTQQGFSLTQVCALADELKMNYRMAKREPGAKVILPAVVNWKVGHYAALLKEDGGRYLMQDPTFAEGNLWISQAALDSEASGYFVIPAVNELPAGWRSVNAEEGKKIFGKGDPGGLPPGPPPCPPGGGGGSSSGGPPCKGMAQYMFQFLLANLHIVDFPVGYAPPRGHAVNFVVAYNQRESQQPAIFSYSNLGNKWTFDWLAYLTDQPANPNANVGYYGRDGGILTYTSDGSGGFQTESYTRTRLSRLSSSSYQRIFPDGETQIFSQSDGATTDRKVFLTSIIDPQGNAINFTYDTNFRLVAAQDAIGQVTTISYELTTNSASGDFFKITKVTDPFGRFASFQYNSNGQLSQITDVIGITSAFTYTNGDFITALTTPYGSTSFASGGDGTYKDRWLEATDPLGQKERMESRMDQQPNYPFSDSVEPSGMNNVNGYLYYRNTFFWDKKAMQVAPGDHSKAVVYHWLHDSSASMASHVLESVKQPLESRVWYNYPGQPWGIYSGNSSYPIAAGRVLDDGTTQLYKYERNDLGGLTKFTDPLGRVTTNNYATNGMDLIAVQQAVGSTNQLLASYAYNNQHLPLIAVDAAGNTNFFGYNTNGQLTALTNALNQVVSLIYDTNAYLTMITGPLGMTNSFTYDGYGRLRTVTDSEGYTVTTSYDALDRPTRVDYLDGTYEQVTYNYLDASLMRDRNGHWTKQMHDPLRHLTDTYDSIGRHTHMDWCSCGALESITDPNGNVTAWTRDLQKRVIAKIYPDLTQTRYQYENTTSRLKSVTDAKNQTTVYNYYNDNNLNSVNYSNAVIATPGVAFTYDPNYNRLLTMVDGVGTNTYSYNAVTNGQLGAGMLSSVANTFTASTVTYNYDALGRITNRAIDGVAEQLTYDALGRVTGITNALGSFTNTYLRATALLTTNFGPNGKTTVFSYLGVTNDQRLAEIWNQNVGGSTLSKFDYGYDALGQITNWTQQVDNTATNVQVMQYDPVNQLLAVTVHGNIVAGAILNQYAYGYDASGNRTTEQIGTGTGGATPVAISQSSFNANNQLTSRTGSGGQMLFAGGTSKPATVNHQTTNFFGYTSVTNGTNVIPVTATDYSANSATNKYQVIVTNNGVAKTIIFDLNGNETSVVTAISTNSYQWDAANRLVSINGPSNQSLFTYDGLGKRVQIIEITNGVAYTTNKYLWTGLRLSEQRTTIGIVAKRFFGQGEQISGTNYYFTRDHLGSIREMVDGSGTIQGRYSYDPYGRRTKVSGNLDADFGYTGDYYHTVSGLCLTFLRAYDPDLGRWLSRDPIAESGGLNLYDYVLNNPVNWLDPYGTDCTSAAGAVGNAIQVGRAGYDAYQNINNYFSNTRSNLKSAATATDFDQNLYALDPATRADAMFKGLNVIGTNSYNVAASAAGTVDIPYVSKTQTGLGIFTGAINYANGINFRSPSSGWHYNNSDSLAQFHLTIGTDITLPNGTHFYSCGTASN